MSVADQIDRRAMLGRLAVIGTTAAAWSSESAHGQLSMPVPTLPQPAMPVAPQPHVGCGVRGRMTGAQAAVRALQLEGTPCVFGIPGAQNNELWDEFKQAELPYLLVSHEFSASVMADAAARTTGTVGVCSVVPGPGLTNTLTGLGEARLDSVPLVVLVTDVKRGPGAPAFQVHQLDSIGLLRPVCKAVYQVSSPDQIPSAIHEAHRLAREGEPGPVGVVVPYDLYIKSAEFNDSGPRVIRLPYDEVAIERAIGMLDAQSGCRVGIYAGQGCVSATQSLRRVAEILQAPVATSVSGKGVFPESHPLSVGWGYGAYGTRAAEEAFRHVDLVLAVGVRFSEVSTANYAVPEVGSLIHVDASPESLERNVKTDLAVCADSQLFLDRLLAERHRIARQPDPRLWRHVARARRRDSVEACRARVLQDVDPMLLYARLNQHLGAEDLLVVDVTSSMHWAAEVYRVEYPLRYVAPMNNQSMGYAIPAAIGAQRVRPDRRVVAVTGDGCLMMSGLELATAARAHLPVKLFVLDDGAYHYMQMLQKPVYRRTTATELPTIGYPQLASALGVAYLEVFDNNALDAVISQAMQIAGPVLVRVRASYEGREIRWLSALREHYIDGLATDQKVRMASRIAGRVLIPGSEND